MSVSLKDMNEVLGNYIQIKMDELEFKRRKNIILQYQDAYRQHRDYYEHEILAKSHSVNKEAQSLSKLLEEGKKEEISLLVSKKRKGNFILFYIQHMMI
jgi:hypothetical protein